jgi:hypothetical protein
MQRSSSSLTGSLHAFSPWWASSLHAASLRLREFPITCAAGLPWTGTTLALANDALAEAMTTVALTTTNAADVCFELHAADCADGRHLPVDQPDAHVPLRDKLRRLRRTLVAIKDAVVDVDGACRQPRSSPTHATSSCSVHMLPKHSSTSASDRPSSVARAGEAP